MPYLGFVIPLCTNLLRSPVSIHFPDKASNDIF